MAKSTSLSREIWKPSERLSSRIAKLRKEYFSFQERYETYTNEVRSYTTGRTWDDVYSFTNWGITPEAVPFLAGFRATLKALAKPINFPGELFSQTIAERKALFFNFVLAEHIPVKILEEELIVGAYFNTALSKTLTEKEARRWAKGQEKFRKELTLRSETGEFNYGAIPGHMIPNYPKILRKGFSGVKTYLKKLRDQVTESKHRAWLKALIDACDGPRLIAKRYSDEAKKLAGEESNPERKEELLEISRICAKVPWKPAESFWEAVQSLWMTHMLVLAAESYPGAGTSPGRIDQYLFPYYQQDIENGAITREFAKELLCCLWIKHNYAYDFQGQVGNSQGINSSFGQLITVGGINENHEDASNDLTWLILEVIEDINLLEPKPNIRLHKKTPDSLMRRVAELIAKTQGSPFLMNFDELSMKGLIWEGIPEDEVWDYAPVGCLENTMQGNDISGTVDVNVNLAKAVELALNNGQDMRLVKQLGPKTGDPKKFTKFDQLMDAYQVQLKALLDRAIKANNFADMLRVEFEPIPYVSLLFEGCGESGKDCRAGGTKYNFITVEGLGFANAADSLAALKKLVFKEKRVTMKDLVEALKKNFEGQEELRQTLISHAPKFGNDDDDVDSIARKISRTWGEYVFTKTAPASGRRYRGGYLSWNYFISFAPKTAALPDGRIRGQYLAGGVGPFQGMDIAGPTASALSVGKLGLEVHPNGSSHTMSFSPASLRDAEHIAKMEAFLRTYGKLGGTALQTNVIDAETLRKAQKHPDQYRNLLVRVTGYNAYFTSLGKEQQDEIIARESHRI
ncbi:MAG: pyruvate formate lyase family protein [Candidatus Hodarchaeota archaeon]